MINLKNQNAFSLLELLIVIAIIVLLATISIIALNGQRAKARDAKRISDIRQIKTALEFYHGDEAEYPIEPNPVQLGPQGRVKLCAKSDGGFVPVEQECQKKLYMSNIPADPLVGQQFSYTGLKEGYDLVFSTEKPSSLGPAGIYHGHSVNIDTLPGNN